MINANIRIGNKWRAVKLEWELLETWEDYAFKKWGFWGLDNTEIETVTGVAIGDWKEIKNFDELKNI